MYRDGRSFHHSIQRTISLQAQDTIINLQSQHQTNPDSTQPTNPLYTSNQITITITITINMNAARQIITRRSAMAMGPRLTQTTRFASTHAHSSSQLSKKDRSMMHGIFTAATLATASGVAFAVSLFDLVLDMLPIDVTARPPSKMS
jgi:hypothetical protein